MSPRSRHAPLPAATTAPYNGYRTSVPRHQALPQSDVCFSSATLDQDMMNANYSLSSGNGSRHYDASAWNASSNSGPSVDDFLPVSGYDSLSLSGSCDPISMMSTTDAMDVTYGLTSTGTLSRHAPLDATSQVSGLTPNMMMDDYAFMDFDQETSFMDGEYLTGFSSNRALTPPSEEYLDYKLASLRHQHTVCEDLGVSKLQPYRLGYTGRRIGRRLTYSFAVHHDTVSTSHDPLGHRRRGTILQALDLTPENPVTHPRKITLTRSRLAMTPDMTPNQTGMDSSTALSTEESTSATTSQPSKSASIRR